MLRTMAHSETTASPVPATRLSLLAGVAVWVLIAGYLLPFTFRGWIPHDEGLLGQLAERTLGGELPHIDFNDPYTGGLSWLGAAAFMLFGVRLTALRILLLLAVLATVPFFYQLTRRFLQPLPAAAITFTSFAWSVPNYFAGLPSWYNLLLAIAALWCLVKAGEAEPSERTRGYALFFAGVLTGLSCLIKISGLFLLAAGILTVTARTLGWLPRSGTAEDGDADEASAVAAEHARAIVCEPHPPQARVFALLATILGVGFVALVSMLVGPLLADASLSRALSVLGHFALPCAVLTAPLLTRAWQARGSSTRWLLRLAARGWPLIAGWALPVVALVAFYAAAGGLGDLARGLFVLPRLRYRFAATPPPPFSALLTLLPIGLLFAAPRFLTRGLLGRVLQHALTTALALGLGLVLWHGAEPMVYAFVWLPLRALVLLVALLGVRRLAHSPSAPRHGAHGRSRAAVSPDALFAVIATTVLMALVQVPTPYGIYFYYVAPLVVLALAAIAAAGPRPVPGTLIVLSIFATGFALCWLNGAYPYSVGLFWRPYAADQRLDLARGGLFVPADEARRYALLVATIDQHAPPGQPIWAAPDCPQVYFLAARPNPTRTFFDFFAPTYRHPAQLLAHLEAWNIPLVVLNRAGSFSPAIGDPVLEALARRYPHARTIDPFVVRWRDLAPPAIGAPGSRAVPGAGGEL